MFCRDLVGVELGEVGRTRGKHDASGRPIFFIEHSSEEEFQKKGRAHLAWVHDSLRVDGVLDEFHELNKGKRGGIRSERRDVTKGKSSRLDEPEQFRDPARR